VKLDHPAPDANRLSRFTPVWTEGSSLALQLDSTLQDLPLCQITLDKNQRGWELAQLFEQHPLLAGVILVHQDHFVGVLSRRRFLEYLLRPHGAEFFLKETLWVLYCYARCEELVFSGTTSILTAAQRALRRSLELQTEPVIVKLTANDYYLLDPQALNIAYWQLRGIETQVRYERTQAELIQSDKMANLGRLIDGVAHEILDPVSFIWGNLNHVSDYCRDLLDLLGSYEQALPQPPAALAQQRIDLEADYIQQDLPQAIASIRSGAERLSKLATSLQNFCHIDDVYPKSADLHELLDSIVLLLKSRLSSEIHFIKHYGHLPPVPCYAGQLNQVFMNVLSMAVDTLLTQAVSQELEIGFPRGQANNIATETTFEPTITISTEVRSLTVGDREERWIAIGIMDNGPALSAESLAQLCASFTVKQRALKETSLGASYQIVTAKHGGKFEIYSPCRPQTIHSLYAVGTEFEILLPFT